MPFAFKCASCAHALIVSDAMHADAAAGRSVTLRCRECGAPLALEARDGAPEVVFDEPTTHVGADAIALTAPAGPSTPRLTAVDGPPANQRARRSSGSWMLMLAALCFAGTAWVTLGRTTGARATAPQERAIVPTAAVPTQPVKTHVGVSSPILPSAVPNATDVFVAPIPPDAPLPNGVKAGTLDYLTYLAIERAEHCHADGHAVGRATVYTTFGPTGRVTDARIEGEPLASAPVSRCILDYAKSVVIPTYSGSPITVVRRIRMR